MQLYARVSGRRVTRPERELVGFTRVSLAPGETKRATFDLDVRILAFHDLGMQLVVTPGPVELLSGPSAANLPLSTAITVVGEPAVLDRRTVFLTGCRVS